MKHTLLILLMSCQVWAAAGQESGKKTDWFPKGQLFPSLRFDFLEAQTTGALYALHANGSWQDQWFANFSAGFRRNVIRFEHPHEMQSELGLELCVFTQFLFEKPFEYFLVNLFNVEFKVGADYQFRLNEHWSFRGRIYHISAHLGDDYIFRYQIEHFIDNQRIYEMIDGAAAWQSGPWMFYGDVGCIFHSAYPRHPLVFQLGGQWNPRMKKKEWVSWLIGADLRLEQEGYYQPCIHTGAGVVLGKPDRHPVTVLIDYYHGYLPYSLYDDVKIQWLGASLYFDPF